jgi:EAL domain-containing protein (putative c-di-GMP-specific phosphodiesterase class I)
MTPSTAVRSRSTTSARLSIAELVENELIASAYQPLVDLYSDEIVGDEALVRGPIGTHLELPAELFAAAHAADMEAEVELECQHAALEGALDVGMAPGQSLFVKFEPRFLARELPERMAELLRTALEHFAVFVEFTERALTDPPSCWRLPSDYARWARASSLTMSAPIRARSH